MKKIFAGFIFLICCFLGFNNIVFAESEYVILGGDSIGLKFSTGVIVSGKYKVETEVGKVKPWEKSDIIVGDKIIEIDNVIVNNTPKTGTDPCRRWCREARQKWYRQEVQTIL